MKKFTVLLAACLAISATLMLALAAGGSSGDPLVSLSHLTGTFTDTVNNQVDQKLNASDQQLLEQLSSGDLSSASASTWAETRLKQGDVLVGTTGTNVLLLAGSAHVTFASGAVIDVTTGTAVSSGTALAANHRYMVAEDTTAQFAVTSKTAVLDYQGPYSFTYSSATDYNAIASALKTIHLFQGSFTGYGSGYDLEVSPTRLQALIMFIRVLGEENAALAWSGTTPFTDITPGTQAAQYVGYAYEKGYTNGYTATTFQPSLGITANQYVEFMLRALGYSSSGNTNLSDTLDRACASGVLNSNEAASLRSGTFLRADLVYVSYYALDAMVSDGSGTLGSVLLNKGVFTRQEWTAAQSPGNQRPEIRASLLSPPPPCCILWTEAGRAGLRYLRRFRYVQ